MSSTSAEYEKYDIITTRVQTKKTIIQESQRQKSKVKYNRRMSMTRIWQAFGQFFVCSWTLVEQFLSHPPTQPTFPTSQSDRVLPSPPDPPDWGGACRMHVAPGSSSAAPTCQHRSEDDPSKPRDTREHVFARTRWVARVQSETLGDDLIW